MGEVQLSLADAGTQEVHPHHISYFSRLVDAKHFEHLTLVEIQRRRLEHYLEVAAVTNGAEWLQSLVDYHCLQAVRILDFPHAAQRITQVGHALLGEGTPQASQWIGERLH
jgi:hypothetical protein